MQTLSRLLTTVQSAMAERGASRLAFDARRALAHVLLGCCDTGLRQRVEAHPEIFHRATTKGGHHPRPAHVIEALMKQHQLLHGLYVGQSEGCTWYQCAVETLQLWLSAHQYRHPAFSAERHAISTWGHDVGAIRRAVVLPSMLLRSQQFTAEQIR